MAAPSNIVQRGRIFHFRRAVPADLRERLKRRELVRSLGACGPKVARLRADELYWLSEQLFETARANPMLTQDQLALLAQSFYNHILERERTVRASGMYLTEDGRAARARYWGDVAKEAKKSLGANMLDHGITTAQMTARMVGLNWSDLDEAERHQCKEVVHRAGIDLAEALKARYEGDFEFEPKSKLLRQALSEVAPAVGPVQRQQPESQAEPIFSTVYPSYIEGQLRRSEWRQQTGNQADATYRLFIQICGDKPISQYTRADAGRFRETAERLPSDYGKAASYKKFTADEIIRAYEKLPDERKSPLLTQKTIKRHFSALSAMWAEAVATGKATENIFSGFKFAAVKRAVDERDQWSDTELTALFGSPVWSGCLSAGRRSQPGQQIIRDDKFWIPLITLLSGMRLEEICQLRTDDIREENGISFFDINDRPPRQLKNKNAVRRVPIHSDLIHMGFLTYIKTLGKGSQPVFPALKPGGADDKLGHGFTKWFTRYRQDIGVYRKNLDFHSLRHTATTLMHQADVSTLVIDHLTGHSTPGETARYTKGSSLQQLAAAIEAIKPGLALAHLYDDR
ncbi:site-specific integrase [Pannonibacter sp. P2PFMT1]|uniref:site-specific integrase n=1 Tax=Pannonibacter sp. P2PFMT1 TaxID=2003582 RepID=UPI001645B9FC|nr:site-specific integrase [Pannonibacter sp. P2PFMT1]